MKKPVWTNNEDFLIFFNRTNKCRLIIDQINKNMIRNGFDFIQSYKTNKKLHIKLFYLGCTIIPYDDLKKIIEEKL